MPTRKTGTSASGISLVGIEQIEVKIKLVLLGDELQAKLKFRVVPGFDGLPQVAAMKIRVAAGQLLRFIPHQRRLAGHRFPVEANEGGFALGVDQTESVDPKAFHGAIAARDAAIRHRPHHIVQRFRLQADIVPESIVGALSLRDGPVRLRLHGVDKSGTSSRPG